MTETTPDPTTPMDVRDDEDQRKDGRPTGTTDSRHTQRENAPTVAPEEEGGEPSTEHAPGGDL